MKTKTLMMAKWVLCIALLTGVSFIYYLNTGITTSKVLYIPQGSIRKIIAHLHERNSELTLLDTAALRLFGGRPQHGWIDMGGTVMTHADYLHRLCTSRAALKNVTLVPGETTFIFAMQAAKALDLNATKLRRAFERLAPWKEGALVPDTYALPVGLDENGTAALLLSHAARTMRQWSQTIFGDWNAARWHRYVVIASIVQKEAASNDEMPIVASVIYNRLNKGMKLQMDGSLNYGRFSHIPVDAGRIRKDRSGYNTYHIKGLPKEPVCNVSFAALHAAIFPAKTDYLYFVKGSDGKHRFTRYYSTHIRNIKHVTK